jgi:hypothetical protein
MAVDIDEAIRDCDQDVAAKIATLLATMNTWIAGMFMSVTAIFGPDREPNADQRTVRDWVAPSIVARNTIEAPASVFAVTVVVDAVFRTLNAVKFAQINGRITTAQRDAVVALYTATWE